MRGLWQGSKATTSGDSLGRRVSSLEGAGALRL